MNRTIPTVDNIDYVGKKMIVTVKNWLFRGLFFKSVLSFIAAVLDSRVTSGIYEVSTGFFFRGMSPVKRHVISLVSVSKQIRLPLLPPV